MDPVVMAAQLFSVRPSALMAIEDPVLALEFDLAAAQKLLEWKKGEDSEPAERLCL